MFLSGSKFKKAIFALLLFGLTFFLYLRHDVIENKQKLSWFDRPVSWVTSPLSKAWLFLEDEFHSAGRYFFLLHVEKENESLKRQVADTQAELIFTQELKSENERLQKLLELKSRLDGHWLGAHVISYPAVSSYRMITIDKGSEEGIRRRTPVTSVQGLVGQVSRVFPHESQVLLIIDPTSAVDGRIEKSEARGLVVGKVLKLEMHREIFIGAFEYLNQSTDIEENAKVLSSGLDGVYPPGLLIGYVHGKKKKKYDIFQQAEVVPAVDFHQLREVLFLDKPDL